MYVLYGFRKTFIVQLLYSITGCVYGKGQQYAGNANVSASGKECLPWKDPTLAHAIRVNVSNYFKIRI